jgi:hypothetical protein
MVMELIRATSPHKGGFLWGYPYLSAFTHTHTYSPVPFSPVNHCSLFLNNTLKVVKDP